VQACARLFKRLLQFFSAGPCRLLQLAEKRAVLEHCAGAGG
jgi:hypothetical protein